MKQYAGLAALAAGACVATLAIHSAAAPATSMYAAPAVTASTTVGAQAYAPVMSGRTAPQYSRVAAAAAAPSDVEMDADVMAEQMYSVQQPSSSWTPLALMAAIPMAVVAAFAAFKPTKKAAALAPMDISYTQEWAMAATTADVAEVAGNYAQALVDLGQSAKNLDQVHTDMENFSAIISDPTFGSFFANPMITPEASKEMIVKICDDINASATTKSFLCFLLDKKRIKYLDAIIDAFDAIYYDVTGTQVATVTAATPLSEEQLQQISQKIHSMTKGKSVKIKSQVNADLLAGFTLEYGKSGSQSVDLSLRGQLNGLESGLKESVRKLIAAGVPAGVQVIIAALGVNAIASGSADAAGNLFDFNATMPIQMTQILLLSVFLEKTVFTPVGDILDARAKELKAKTTLGGQNNAEIAKMQEEADALLSAAKKEAGAALEKAKKEATATGAARLAAEKSKIDASLKTSSAELQAAKAALWAKLETDVVPKLADDILAKVIPTEAAVAK
jgi:F-type H+-transporting ATPase subunit delta